MNTSTSTTLYWHGIAAERLQQQIAQAFGEVRYLECNTIDGIPSVEINIFPAILTPAQVLEFGQRLQEAVGAYPIRFQEMRATGVVFLVVHDLMRDGHPFRDGHVDDYGVPFEALAQAWALPAAIKKLSDEELSQWIGALDHLEISADTEEIAGVRVRVSEESSPHSADVSMSMTVLDYGIELTREGRKVISYDRWCDTDWFGWEHANGPV